MTRVRISILTMALLICGTIFGSEIVLPNYVGEGAHSYAVFVNATDHPIQLPGDQLCSPFGCVTVPGPIIASGVAYSVEMPPPARGVAGLTHVSVPDGAYVFGEVVLGSLALFRTDNLPALDTAQYYDVGHDGPYNGWVFVGVDAPTVISYYGQTYQLQKNDALVLPVGQATFKLVAQLGAHIYTFAGINCKTNGSNQLILPH